MLSGIIGFFSGIVSGMGIGGGAVLIPALIMLCATEQKVAQGINLAYFIPTAIISLIVHIKNKAVDIKSALIIGLLGSAGSAAGALLAMRTDSLLLKKAFGFFLLFIGIKEIIKGLKPKSKT